MIFPYRKILVVGCGGAGKSTLARAIGSRFGIPVVHLDRLWWLPDWQEREEEEFDDLLARELAESEWIIDGNFLRTFPERLRYADFCVFLDVDTDTCMQSVYERAERYRGQTRPDMTEGCVEEIHPDFRNWILSFRETVFPNMLQILQNSGVPYRIFSTRTEAYAWLNSFSPFS